MHVFVLPPLLQFSVHAAPASHVTLHAVDPLHVTVQSPAGHFTSHMLLP
jgi:hypothetical protein